ncbi:MAG: DUF305 domain-containing protein [Gallionellaceae bacterium]|nr:DUF305 domain-containing protein [Gallionellaceae bacterium]
MSHNTTGYTLLHRYSSSRCTMAVLALTVTLFPAWSFAQTTTAAPGTTDFPSLASPSPMTDSSRPTDFPHMTDMPRMNNRSMDSSMNNGENMSQQKSSSKSGKSMSKSGDADYDFAVNMRKHHQKALDMARTQLNSGKDFTLTRMAEDIIAAQTREISQLDRWLSEYSQNK